MDELVTVRRSELVTLRSVLRTALYEDVRGVTLDSGEARMRVFRANIAAITAMLGDAPKAASVSSPPSE